MKSEVRKLIKNTKTVTEKIARDVLGNVKMPYGDKNKVNKGKGWGVVLWISERRIRVTAKNEGEITFRQ